MLFYSIVVRKGKDFYKLKSYFTLVVMQEDECSEDKEGHQCEQAGHPEPPLAQCGMSFHHTPAGLCAIYFLQSCHERCHVIRAVVGASYASAAGHRGFPTGASVPTAGAIVTRERCLVNSIPCAADVTSYILCRGCVCEFGEERGLNGAQLSQHQRANRCIVFMPLSSLRRK